MNDKFIEQLKKEIEQKEELLEQLRKELIEELKTIQVNALVEFGLSRDMAKIEKVAMELKTLYVQENRYIYISKEKC